MKVDYLYLRRASSQDKLFTVTEKKSENMENKSAI